MRGSGFGELLPLPFYRSIENENVFILSHGVRDGRGIFGQAKMRADRPSARSSAIDALAFDAETDRTRLFIVSAGNVEGQEKYSRYPASNAEVSIKDPAQSWNALTVGAYTVLEKIEEKRSGAYHPVARAGELSPYSATSVS
jgi:hypothetical protein